MMAGQNWKDRAGIKWLVVHISNAEQYPVIAVNPWGAVMTFTMAGVWAIGRESSVDLVERCA